MQLFKNGTISWLAFDHLSECPRIIHGVFLRDGGVSSGPFESLNFGASQGDLPHNIESNRLKALSCLSLTTSSSLFQEHGSVVVEAKQGEILRGDGLMSDQPNTGLLVMHADCQAAVIYDPINHAIANVHCGWRGNIQNIYQNVIESMRARYGSLPENLLIGISPSLGPSCAEFIHYETEFPPSFWEYQIKPNYFDLWAISEKQLIDCGVLPHHIEIAKMCTYSNPDLFFSYRRLKISGRHGTIAALI